FESAARRKTCDCRSRGVCCRPKIAGDQPRRGNDRNRRPDGPGCVEQPTPPDGDRGRQSAPDETESPRTERSGRHGGTLYIPAGLVKNSRVESAKVPSPGPWDGRKV